MVADPLHRDVLRLTIPAPTRRSEPTSEANSSVQVNLDTSSNGAQSTTAVWPSGISFRLESPEPPSLSSSLRRQATTSSFLSSVSSQQDRPPSQDQLPTEILSDLQLTPSRGVKRPHESDDDDDDEAEDRARRKRDKLEEELAELASAVQKVEEPPDALRDQEEEGSPPTRQQDVTVEAAGTERIMLVLRPSRKSVPSRSSPKQVLDDDDRDEDEDGKVTEDSEN